MKNKIKNNDNKETRKDLSKTNILIKFCKQFEGSFFSIQLNFPIELKTNSKQKKKL